MSLFAKLALFTSAVAISIVVVMTLISVSQQTQALGSELISGKSQAAEQVAAATKNSFKSLNWLFMEDMVRAVGKAEDVAFCRIVKPDGTVYLADKRRDYGRTVDRALMDTRNESIDYVLGETGEKGTVIIKPVFINGERWRILIGISLKEIKHANQVVVVHNLYLALGIILVAGLLTFIASRGLTRPVTKLAQAAGKVAGGDLDISVDVKSKDEVGALGIAFNSMIESLRASREELRIYSEGLEAKVQERTKALQESEERFRDMASATGDWIWERDLERRYVYVSPAVEKVLGYTPEEMLGQDLYDLCLPTEKEKWKEIASDLVSRKEPFRNLEARKEHKDGHTVILEVSGIPVVDKQGELVGFRGATTDITERRQMESELLNARKLEALGTLAAGIAHEINTPIQYVGDNIRFFQDSFSDISHLLNQYQALLATAKKEGMAAEKVAEVETAAEEADMDFLSEEVPQAIKQSLDGIERVSGIVRAMKEFAHPGTEEKVLTDLNRNIDNTVTIARSEWKYVADVITDLAPDLPQVPCFPGDMGQVILNLVINAAHSIAQVISDDSGEKGRIRISTRRDDGWAEIRVSDTGTGIPNEIRDKIFDPFFTTKEVGKGTGQGLTLVRSIIFNKHGGTINIESEIGKGTTFLIRLPLGDSTT